MVTKLAKFCQLGAGRKFIINPNAIKVHGAARKVNGGVSVDRGVGGAGFEECRQICVLQWQSENLQSVIASLSSTTSL